MNTPPKRAPYSAPLLEVILRAAEPAYRAELERLLTAPTRQFYGHLADQYGSDIAPVLSELEQVYWRAKPATETGARDDHAYSFGEEVRAWEASFQAPVYDAGAIDAGSSLQVDIDLLNQANAGSEPNNSRFGWGPLLRLRLAIWPQEFGTRMMPEYARLPFSPLHRAIFDWRRAGLAPFSPGRRGRRLALAAPRGAAKTTVGTLFTALHALLYGTERYIVIISATLPQSQKRLQQIGRELLENERLRWLYPPLRKAGFHRTINGKTLDAAGTRIEAKSPGSQMRGMMYGAWRPTLIILDDAESNEISESDKRRAKLIEWFADVIEPLGDSYTSIMALGTLLHRESLLAHLLERLEFEAYRFSAVERWATNTQRWREWRQLYQRKEGPDAAAAYFAANRSPMLRGARVLWPEKEPYIDLMQQLVAMGPRAFAKEKMNEPRDHNSAIFRPKDWSYFRVVENRIIFGGRPLWLESGCSAPNAAILNAARGDHEDNHLAWLQDEEIKDRRQPGAARRAQHPSPKEIALTDLTVVGYLDSATGAANGEGDDAAIAVLGCHGEFTYLLDIWMEEARPLEQIARLFDLHERWNFARFGFEANVFQALLGELFKKERAQRKREGRAFRLRAEPIHNSKSKAMRIEKLDPALSCGWMYVSADLPDRFYEQAAQYPGGRHDDGLDALAGAYELAQRFIPDKTSAPLHTHARRKANGY